MQEEIVIILFSLLIVANVFIGFGYLIYKTDKRRKERKSS